MQVLVDTSVWSLALRRRTQVESSEIALLQKLISDGHVEIIGPIRQEILSGVREPQQFERLRAALEPFVDVSLGTADFEEAARICNVCLDVGIATGSTDCLIASVAIRHGWELLTTDQDFIRIASCTDLRLCAVDP